VTWDIHPKKSETCGRRLLSPRALPQQKDACAQKIENGQGIVVKERTSGFEGVETAIISLYWLRRASVQKRVVSISFLFLFSLFPVKYWKRLGELSLTPAESGTDSPSSQYSA